MATMPTFTTGHLVTASEWNTHATQINDNTTAIATNTSGLASGTTSIDALKTEVFGGSSRTGKPKCTVSVTTNVSPYFQTLNYTTDTMLNWQTEVTDTDSMFTAGQSGITVPVAGLYLSTVSLNLAAQTGTVTGSCAVKLYQNTTEPNPNAAGNVTNVLGTNTAPWNYAGEGPVVTLTSVVQLAAGAVLRVAAWHNFNNGANLAVGVKGGFNAKGTAWSVTYLGK